MKRLLKLKKIDKHYYSVPTYSVTLLSKFKKKFKETNLPFKVLDFIRWKIIDIYRFFKNGKRFSEYGIDIYCGRQGYGKTIGMVEYLERMRKKYPKCIIVTNLYYRFEDRHMSDWRDLLEIRNRRRWSDICYR